MFKNVGVVVAHPAHLLSIMGMVLRWQPKILLLTRALEGSGSGQSALIEKAFALANLQNAITDITVDEAEAYRRTLSGDYDFYISQIPRIANWLRANSIDTVFGDAFELSNYQHDVGRVLLDKAVELVRKGGQTISNYEFPLSVQANDLGAELIYGRFLGGLGEAFHLNELETSIKAHIIQMAQNEDILIAHVAPQFPGIEIEYYREVPADRNYLMAPEGMARYYDEFGRNVVAAGKYETAISYEKHFLPIVNRVGQL